MRRKILSLSCALVLMTSLFTGCKKSSEIKINSNPASSQTQTENIDEKTGLRIVGKLDLKYAKSFSIDYLENGIKKYTDSEKRVVYLLPEGKTLEMKESMEKINTVSVPIKTAISMSTVDLAQLRPLNGMDKVVGCTVKAETWKIPEVKKSMEEGKIQFVGDKNALNFEKIASLKSDVVLFTYENMDRTQKNAAKLDEIKQNWVGLANHMEKDPRAKLEGILFFGELLGKEKEAREFVDKEIEKINMIEKKNINEQKRKTFASTFISKELFYTRNAGDYETKMFNFGGGKYAFSDLNPEKDGNTKMNAEEFYKGAKDADILFYNSVNGPSVKSKADLIKAASFLSEMKAIKEDNVWSVKPHYFQSMDKIADMVNDIDKIMHMEEKISETEYFIKLK